MPAFHQGNDGNLEVGFTHEPAGSVITSTTEGDELVLMKQRILLLPYRILPGARAYVAPYTWPVIKAQRLLGNITIFLTNLSLEASLHGLPHGNSSIYWLVFEFRSLLTVIESGSCDGSASCRRAILL